MNTLDNLLLLVFVAVFLFYCYKKKKLFFSRLRKEPKTENEEQTTIQGIQAPAQIIPFNLQGIQAPFVNYSPAPVHTSFCRLIPFTIYHVLDKDTESAQVNAFILQNVTDFEASLNNEIKNIVSKGYTVTGVNAVSFIMNDLSAHFLYCITYGR